MKKVIAFILALACVLSLCACSSNKDTSANPTPTNNSNTVNNSSSAKNSTVNLNDYIIMTTQSHEKYGVAHCHMDIESMMLDNCDEQTVEKINKTFNKEYYSISTVVLCVTHGELGKIEPTFTYATENWHLSNGDVIHVSWENIDSDFCKKLESCLGVKFTYNDFDLTVTDLEPIKPYDLFSNIEMHSSDISGSGSYPTCIAKVPMTVYQNGTVTESTYDVYLSPVSTDRNGQLANGDTVRYMIDEESMHYMEMYCGRVPEQTEGNVVLNCFQ